MRQFFKTFEVIGVTYQIMIELGRKPGVGLFLECWDTCWGIYLRKHVNSQY